MQDPHEERIATLEQRQRLTLAVAVIVIILLSVVVLEPARYVHAQNKQEFKALTVSELSILDSQGVVRVRLGGDLPDAVIDGKVKPRGERAAGLLLYDETGQERSGYVTFAPSGNVGLTLDNRSGQTAEFIAGPDSGSVIRLHWRDDAVELRVDEDGPSIYAVRRKNVAFHEPTVENPESTAMCKALREAKTKLPIAQLLDACRARTSEAACQACLAK